MNVEYINSFVEAGQRVLKSIADINSYPGKAYLKTASSSKDILNVFIKLKGDISGLITLSMNKEVTCKIASAMMMGMPIKEVDEISKSAVIEAANMILVKAATILHNKGINIDITPPSLLMENDTAISEADIKMICIPINISSNEVINLNIAAVN